MSLNKFSSGLGVTVRISRQARSHSFVSVERDVVPSRGTKLGSPLPSQQHTHPALLSLQQAAGGGGVGGLAVHGEGPEGPPVGTGPRCGAGPGSL